MLRTCSDASTQGLKSAIDRIRSTITIPNTLLNVSAAGLWDLKRTRLPPLSPRVAKRAGSCSYEYLHHTYHGGQGVCSAVRRRMVETWRESYRKQTGLQFQQVYEAFAFLSMVSLVSCIEDMCGVVVYMCLCVDRSGTYSDAWRRALARTLHGLRQRRTSRGITPRP
jgi:hypothetical protein